MNKSLYPMVRRLQKMLNLVHKLSTIECFAKAGNFQFFLLIWIKQVIIPVATSEKNKLIKYDIYPQYAQTLIRGETYVSS